MKEVIFQFFLFPKHDLDKCFQVFRNVAGCTFAMIKRVKIYVVSLGYSISNQLSYQVSQSFQIFQLLDLCCGFVIVLA